MIPQHHACYSERNVVQNLGPSPIAVDLIVLESDEVSFHSLLGTEELALVLGFEVVAVNVNSGNEVMHGL